MKFSDFSVADDRGFLQKEHKCPSCNAQLDSELLKQNFYVCSQCGHHFRISAPERLRFLADNGEYQEFSSDLQTVNPLEFPEYEEKVKKSQQKTGLNEAVQTVLCRIEGREAVVGIMNFQFLGGSMGSVVGEKIARAILLAAQRGLPCILFTASGGARMHEGIFSLMQMAKTSHAAALLEQVGQPLFIVLTDPTTGGVTASFAMLGDVTLAEPNALIGFAGPRVIEGIMKQKLPIGFQRAEFQQEKGFVDKIVPRSQLRKTLAFLIDAHSYEGGKA
ncbi:acetyl-CoA carboxylase, carboxyltransferase subunit beta [Salinispira pacifica]